MWEQNLWELALVSTGINVLAAVLAITISRLVEYFFFPPLTRIIWRGKP